MDCRLRHCLLSAVLVLHTSPVLAQTIAVYHSPGDSGVDQGVLPLTPNSSTTLHLYLDPGSDASANPDPCCAGQGDEVLGWNLVFRGLGGLTLGTVTPAPGVLSHQTATELHLNGGDALAGDLGPTKLADVVVQTGAVPGGHFVLVRGQATGATLALAYVPPRLLATPEPSSGSLLLAGILGLVGWGARRASTPRRRKNVIRPPLLLLGFVLGIAALVAAMAPESSVAAALCGDLDRDDDVDAVDAAILRADLAESVPMTLAQSLACNVVSESRAANLAPDPNDLAAQCSMSDVVVMQRAGSSAPPGIAPVCAVGSSASCCSAHAGAGCDTEGTVACVCAQNPSCCTSGWSAACATLACTTACQPGCFANPVAGENCRTSADGVVPRAVWDLPGHPAASVCYSVDPLAPCTGIPIPIPPIEGFATEFTATPGGAVGFKVENRTLGGPAAPYTGEIFRVGWYGGAGARRVATLSIPPASQNTPQPACANRCLYGGSSCPSLETFRDCSNWSVSTQWNVPADAVSGVYLARFTRSDGKATHVPFVVREAPGAPPADILYQIGDHTWQAYNHGVPPLNSGVSDYGDWLYSGSGGPRGVSYNRPFRNRHFPNAGSFFFELELPLIAFLERNGFSVSYVGSAELDLHPELLTGRSAFLSAGHDEYGTGERRNALENAVAAGTHLLFLGVQHNFIKTRWQDVSQIDARRVEVAYKFGTESVDPRRNDLDWSGVWRDTRTDQGWTRPPAQPTRPENALSGTATGAAAPDAGNLAVPLEIASQRFWRDTCAGTPGCNLGLRNVGYEYDIRADRYYEAHARAQPPGLFSVTATNLSRPLGLIRAPELDYGVHQFENAADYSLPQLTSEATLYRHASGALVFSAATMRWSWGLDSARNDGNTGTSSRAVQQAMLNVLADMGIQPAFVRKDPTNLADPELVRAMASVDTTPPTSVIESINPATGLITGHASDTGGAVAGVEVSSDAGVTWHGANLVQAGASTGWSYASVVPASVAALVRAVDDSGNLETAHGASPPIPPSSGSALVTVAGSVGWQQNTVYSFTAAPGWTSIVPLRLDLDLRSDLVSYNAVTGQADFSVAVEPPACSTGVACGQQGVSSVAATPGWTLVVPLDLDGNAFTDLLSYNAATGVLLYSIAVSPGACPPGIYCGQQTLPPVPPFVPNNTPPIPTPETSVGWTSIVPMNLDGGGGTDLVFYNAATGLVEYAVADTTGCTIPGVACRQRVVSFASAKRGWTAVVPLDLDGNGRTDLLSYDAATGRADYSVASTSNCAGGVSCGQAILTEATVAPGFTTIVPVRLNADLRTDLLWYDASTGQATFTIATTDGCAPGISCTQSVVAVQNVGTGWNQIVPVRLNADDLSDLIWYR